MIFTTKVKLHQITVNSIAASKDRGAAQWVKTGVWATELSKCLRTGEEGCILWSVYGLSALFSSPPFFLFTPSTSTYHPSRAGLRHVLLRQLYLKFYPEGTDTFSKAKAICERDGGYLAIVNSQAEMDIMKAIFSLHPNIKEYAYVGFIRQYGQFVTIFGDPLSEAGYEGWAEGEPNNTTGHEDCGSVMRTGGLNDEGCEKSVSIPFFCERDRA